jgi:hypothetical protein
MLSKQNYMIKYFINQVVITVNELTEPVSGISRPQFGDESSLSARFRAGSRFKRFLCFVVFDLRCFGVLHAQDRRNIHSSCGMSEIR